MADPARFIAGFTQDQSTQPLGSLGIPNPFWYAQDFDDFLPYIGTEYEITASGAGSVSSYGIPGGGIILTGAAGATNTIGMQRDVAEFDLTQGKKFGYVARVGLNGTATANLNVLLGLCPITNNVMALNAAGVYIFIGDSGEVIFRVSDGATSSVYGVLPITVTLGGYLDVGFSYDPGTQEISAWAGYGLVGQRTVDPNTVALGPTFRGFVPNFPAIGLVSPTIGFQQLLATSANFVLDFHGTFMER